MIVDSKRYVWRTEVGFIWRVFAHSYYFMFDIVYAYVYFNNGTVNLFCAELIVLLENKIIFYDTSNIPEHPTRMKSN